MTAPTRSEIFFLPAALPLECDELMLAPMVAFETYGEKRPDAAVLLLHGVTHSHCAASGEPPGPDLPYSPDAWFANAVGPGKPIDTDTFWVISCGLLGSPWGSSSPVSPNPETGSPYSVDFPPITATDMARAAGGLCRSLGVTRLAGVVGHGFGGMVALRLASLFPETVASVTTLGTTASLPDSLRRKLASVRQQLDADRAFKHGQYTTQAPPEAAMQRVRLGLLRELYPRDYLARIHGDLFAAERALDSEATEFSWVFDANCYAALCDAHARTDLYESLGRIKARTLVLTASTDVLAPPERARDTYHRLTASGVQARYYELQSDAGHRAYELEAAKVGMVIRDFLGR